MCSLQKDFFHSSVFPYLFSALCPAKSVFLCCCLSNVLFTPTSPSCPWLFFFQHSSVHQHHVHKFDAKAALQWQVEPPAFGMGHAHHTYTECGACKWGHSTLGSARRVCSRVSGEGRGLAASCVSGTDQIPGELWACRVTSKPSLFMQHLHLGLTWAVFRIRSQSPGYPVPFLSCLKSVQRGEEALTIKSRLRLY